MRVAIYVEGGGDSKELHSRCREAFHKLIKKSGFPGRMPKIVACGSREGTYSKFSTAIEAGASHYCLLLVDSEAALTVVEEAPESPHAWRHLRDQDKWEQPKGTEADQAQLMVSCMETWILADRAGLKKTFGEGLSESSLLPLQDLEDRTPLDAQNALKNATRACGRDKAYAKGRRSFQVLSQVDPAELAIHLPHFRRFVATLRKHLRAQS